VPIQSCKPYILNFSCRAWLNTYAIGLAVGGFSLLSVLSANADKAAPRHPPVVTPIEREFDRQGKLLLEEKITRELKENQKRIKQQSESAASTTRQKVSPSHKEDGE